MERAPSFNPQVEKERLKQMQEHKDLASQLDSQKLDELDQLRQQINKYQATLETQYQEKLKTLQRLKEEEEDLEEESSEFELEGTRSTPFEAHLQEYCDASDKLEQLRKSITSRPPARILTETALCERIPPILADLRTRYGHARTAESCSTINSMGLKSIKSVEIQDEQGAEEAQEEEKSVIGKPASGSGSGSGSRPGTAASGVRGDVTRRRVTAAGTPSSLAKQQPKTKVVKDLI